MRLKFLVLLGLLVFNGALLAIGAGRGIQSKCVADLCVGLVFDVGDRDAAQLIVSNLLSNAIRYTPPGGKVRIEWIYESPFSVMRVSDTGIGIPESDMKHLFTEFFRAENAKKFTGSGTGLGLTITKNIIERMGGTISVESTEGRGTTFTVRLPMMQ